MTPYKNKNRGLLYRVPIIDARVVINGLVRRFSWVRLRPGGGTFKRILPFVPLSSVIRVQFAFCVLLLLALFTEKWPRFI